MCAPYIVVKEYSACIDDLYHTVSPASSETTPTSILYVQMADTNHSTIISGAFRPRRANICELGR